MELRHYLRVLRERWLLVALCLAVSVGGAAGYTFSRTPMYEAHTKLFVSTSDTDSRTGAATAYQGGLFSQQRVKSYTDIVASPPVTAAVISELHLQMAPDELQSKISATAPVDTVLIQLTVRDEAPARAKAIADSVDRAFTRLVTEIETPTGSTVSPIKVSVVQSASRPSAPVSPRKTMNMAVGLLAGLASGLGLALLLDALDNTVARRDEIADVAGAPPLAVIAEDPQAESRPLIVQDDQFSPRAEAFRQLRTAISFLGVDREIGSFVVSSALPGEGKTTTTANLAIALAQAGKRVVVVDADLRRPQLAEVFGLGSSMGLTDVLLDRTPLKKALQVWQHGLPLMLLACGTIPPNPSELLASSRMSELIATLRAQADVVLVDVPPLLPVTDAAVLAKVVDGAILVARAGSTKKDQLAQASETLASVGATVLGVVLNRKPRHGKASTYDSYTAERYRNEAAHDAQGPRKAPVAKLPKTKSA